MKNIEEKEQQNNNYSRFDTMDTEVLADLLKADFDAPPTEQMAADEALYIAHLIAERKGMQHKDLTAAKEEFFAQYYPLKDERDVLYEDEEKPAAGVIKLSRLRRWAGAVAAMFLVMICGSVTAFALGYDPFGFKAMWNDDVFWFENENVAEEMQNLVLPYADVENLLPKWVPARYEVYEDALTDEYDDHIDAYVVYANTESAEEDILHVGILYWPNGTTHYYKDSKEVVVYTLNDTDFYIMFDKDWTNVVWHNGRAEYYIMGRITEKEAKKMIKSIYE